MVASRLVGAKTQVPLKLKGRDPLLRGAHQAKRDHPLVKGMWLSSKIVPTVTVNCSRQAPALHWKRPGRALSPLSLVTEVSPQWGQTGPLGQRIDSSRARASSSLSRAKSARVSLLSALGPEFPSSGN